MREAPEAGQVVIVGAPVEILTRRQSENGWRFRIVRREFTEGELFLADSVWELLAVLEDYKLPADVEAAANAVRAAIPPMSE